MTEADETEALQAKARYWEDRATKTEIRLQQTIEKGRARLDSLSNQLAQAESRCNILQAELEKQPKTKEIEPVKSSEIEEKLRAAEERARVFEGELRDIHYKVADRFLKGASHDWFSPLNADLRDTPPPARVEELLDQHYRLLAFGEAQRQRSNRLEESNTELSLELMDLRRQIAQPSAQTSSLSDSEDRELQRIAFEDALTGLPNQALAARYVEQQLQQLEVNGGTLGLFVVALNNLGDTNLTLGIEAGDALVQAFAERLKGQLRHEQVLTRGHHDEFYVVLTVPEAGPEGISAARQELLGTATRIFESVLLPLEAGGHRILVSIAAGGILCQRNEPLRILIERAHLALKEAKLEGPNRFHLHCAEMEEDGRRRLLMVPQLLKAVEENQFTLQFQPVVDLKSQKIWGVEAQIGWKHPTAGMISFESFLDVALDTGLIVPIGDWVVRECARIASQLVNHHLSFSLTAFELMQADFTRKFTKALELAHVTRPNRLVIEIPERDLLQESDRLKDALNELRLCKTNLAVKNFGFENLSLKHVQSARISYVKLSRQLVQGLDSPTNQALISASVQLGATIGCQTWAVGVDSPEQLKQLKALGVHLAQGKALYAPMTSSDLREKLN